MKRILAFYSTMLAAAIVLAVSPAAAATQGSLAATSTGSVLLSVTVPQRVEISGLTDVTFTSADPNSAAANNQDVCVWSNTATHNYSIVASGSGAGGAFTLANSINTNAPVQPYTVAWAASTGSTSGTALVNGTALSSQTSTAPSPNCSTGTKSASLILNVPTTSLQNMYANNAYTGTVTLVVAPM